MRVEVDRERCCGAGNCVRTVPQVFDQDDRDGLVVLRQPHPPESVADALRQVVDLCPAGAITVH
jgi:ferredoxin